MQTAKVFALVAFVLAGTSSTAGAAGVAGAADRGSLGSNAVTATAGHKGLRVGGTAGVARASAASLPMTEALQALEGMRRDLEREAKEEEDTYKSMACWCTSNEEEKNTAIDDAKARVDALEATVEAASGEAGSLTASIAQMKQDVADGEEALKSAASIRQKEAAAFHAQETDLLQSIQLLNGAITALSKHHPSMLQAGSELSADTRKLLPALRHLVHKHLPLLGFLHGSAQGGALVQFLQASPDLLDADEPDASAPALLQNVAAARRTPPFFKSYTPQSGQIFGVLRQMKEAFEEDLPLVQKDEVAKVAAYAEMKGSKESELQQLRATIKAQQAKLGQSKAALSAANEEMEDTKASMSEDQKFLVELTKRCTEGDHEWEKRKKLRAEEIAAVSEAIAILDQDKVRDAQLTTFGFLQMSTSLSASARRQSLRSPKTVRDRAITLLEHRALQAPGLVSLLEMARNASSPFTKVLSALDALAAKLKVEQADEVKHRDFCLAELHENEVDDKRKEAEFTSLDAQVTKLAEQGKALGEALSTLKAEVQQLHVDLQGATLRRRDENMQFQHAVADQKRARSALERAYNRLAAFYNVQPKPLLQLQVAQEPGGRVLTRTGDMPELKDVQPHSSANRIMGLIQKLAGDARVLEDASVNDEQNAQKAYESLVGSTNDSVKAKSRLIADKSEELAFVDKGRLRAIAERGEVVAARGALAESTGTLHAQCDFLLANFAARQEARSAEMDALADVKAILGGMNV